MAAQKTDTFIIKMCNCLYSNAHSYRCLVDWSFVNDTPYVGQFICYKEFTLFCPNTCCKQIAEGENGCCTTQRNACNNLDFVLYLVRFKSSVLTLELSLLSSEVLSPSPLFPLCQSPISYQLSTSNKT